MKQNVLIGIVATVLVALLIAIIFYLRPQDEGLDYSLPLTVAHDQIEYDVQVSANKDSVTQDAYARHRFVVKQNNALVDLVGQMVYPHVAVVSDDLSDITFYHVDKLAVPKDGIYEFDHLFSAVSDYQLWFELNDNTTENHHGSHSNYIAHVPVANSDGAGSAPSQVENRSVARDRDYQLQLNQTTFPTNTPVTVQIEITDSAGKAVPVYRDYEQHFFFIADPLTDFYILDHFDETLSGASSIAASFVFPAPGKYALWGRIFITDTAGDPIDFAEGSFVVSAQ